MKINVDLFPKVVEQDPFLNTRDIGIHDTNVANPPKDPYIPPRMGPTQNKQKAGHRGFYIYHSNQPKQGNNVHCHVCNDTLPAGNQLLALLQLFSNFINNDVKMNIPEFKGDLSPDEFLDWLLKCETIFSYKKYGDPKRVQLTETHLNGYTLNWWNSKQRNREAQGFTHVVEWEKIKRDLRAEFLPPTYESDLSRGIQETEQTRLGRYIQGLRRPIQQLLDLQNITELSYAYQAALKAEMNLQDISNPAVPIPTTTPHAANYTAQPVVTFIPGYKCYIYNEIGHLATDCLRKEKGHLFTDVIEDEEGESEHVAALTSEPPCYESLDTC
ncbi:hypothetical protein FRX31_021400 [Thalictrum thalictroides]|uniref:Retrotransposon gag domain-containing protein n=1 Tax=Thalictrum thalictroides TaxID=46969 RepID=A0A7J6VW04_THATH|nr:hypothetical protein FRX31_021400 [Thalictrum thalictroides]